MPELNRRRLIIGVVLALLALVGLYLLIPRIVGLNQTWGRFKEGDPWLLGLAGVLELLSIAGYMVLFRTVVGRGMPRINRRAAVEIVLAGIAAIRIFAAAGAGGLAVSAWALSRAGMSARAIGSRLVATYVIQYSIYLGAMIVCGLGLWFGVFAGGGAFSLTVVPAVFSAVVIVLVLSMALLPADFERRLAPLARRSGRIGRWAARLAAAPATVGRGVRTSLWLVRERRVGLLGAVVYWALDITVLGICFKAFGQDMTLAVLIMGYFLGTLGGLLPVPGGIGGIDGAMIGAFVAFGIPADRALVGVLAYRAISFWLPTIPGLVGYFRLRSRMRGWRQVDEQATHG